MMELLVVALAGALGGAARFQLSGLVGRHIGETFPFGTLVVNVTGAAAIGATAGMLPGATQAGAELHTVWLGLVVGFLGAYTTVSSFSLQTLALARGGEFGRAALNILASVLLCITSALGGFLLTAR